MEQAVRLKAEIAADERRMVEPPRSIHAPPTVHFLPWTQDGCAWDAQGLTKANGDWGVDRYEPSYSDVLEGGHLWDGVSPLD